jgi:hypothetical protein
VDEETQNDNLSGFTDPAADEVARWERVEREALILCDPLARMIGHKNITHPLGMSAGQLSKELSASDDKRLSLAVGLCILNKSQNDKLARLLICDAAGYRLPEPQKRKATAEEELKALKEELRQAGSVGSAIIGLAQARLRAGR